MEDFFNLYKDVISSLVGTGITIVFSIIIIFQVNKSNSIAEKTHLRTNPKISIDILNEKYTLHEESHHYYFEFIASNLSSANNSIKEIKLEVFYSLGKGQVSLVISQRLDDPLSNEDILPCNLESGTSKALKAIFEVPDNLIKEKRIEYYKLILYDSFGKKFEKPIYLTL